MFTGTLGKHKKEQFESACVCLFVFDCLHINGVNIMDKPIKERKKMLKDNMTQIDNRVMFSEMKIINVSITVKSGNIAHQRF